MRFDQQPQSVLPAFASSLFSLPLSLHNEKFTNFRMLCSHHSKRQRWKERGALSKETRLARATHLHARTYARTLTSTLKSPHASSRHCCAVRVTARVREAWSAKSRVDDRMISDLFFSPFFIILLLSCYLLCSLCLIIIIILKRM